MGNTKQTQSGIDAVTAKSPSIASTLAQEVEGFINGIHTAAPNRADNQQVLCPAIKPGNTPPVPGDPAMVVTISPNSPGNAAQQATAANQQIVNGFSTDGFNLLINVNPNRLELIIQNVGTTTLYIVLGVLRGIESAVNYHFALAPGGGEDDGTGGFYVSDLWKGAVQIAGSADGGLVSVVELTN